MEWDGYKRISARFIEEALTLLKPAVEEGKNSIIIELPEDDDGFAPLLEITLRPRPSDIEKCDLV